METKIKYFIGIDGGGTGTRVAISDLSGSIIAKAEGHASALGLGIDQAWRSILDTIAHAFYIENIPIPMISECALGIGISGANNILWKNEFLLKNPGAKAIEVETDGITTLYGAHDGKPGSIIAIGTGSIGMSLHKNGHIQSVSGWGYPSGDEASGFWIGLKAMRLLQKVIDARVDQSPLTQEMQKQIGQTPDEILKWLESANQNKFAKIAPLVFACAHHDIEAKNILMRACEEILLMAKTINPQNELPLALCGGIGEALLPYFSKNFKEKLVHPQGPSTSGALYLIQKKRGSL